MTTARSHATGALFAAGLATTVVAALAAPAAAAAAPSGLTFLPAKGLASTPMTLLVPAACPAASTNVVARAFGHGFPAIGQTVITNSTAGVSQKAPFALPLQDTFTGFAADNGTQLSGPYRITLRCINRLGNKTYASFTGTVTFADTAHFSAPAPTAALVNQIQQAEQPILPPPSTSGSRSAGKGSTPGPSANAGQSKGAAAAGTGSTTGSGTTSGAAPASQSIHKKSSFPWQPTLVVAAFVLIGLGILLRIRELRSGRRREQARLEPTAKTTSATSDKSARSATLTSSGSAKNHGKGHQS